MERRLTAGGSIAALVMASAMALFVAGCTTTSEGTTPEAPTGVTATAGDGQVTVSWTEVSGATSYNVYWAEGLTVSVSSGNSVGVTTPPATVTELVNGTEYAFIATAVNANGESEASAVAVVSPSAAAGGTGPFTVTYNGNGATGGSVPVDTATYTKGSTVTVLGNTGSLVKTGYAYAGWGTTANGIGGNVYSGGGTFNMGSSNVTLYAQWVSPTSTWDGSFTSDVGGSGGAITDWSLYFDGTTTGTWTVTDGAISINAAGTYTLDESGGFYFTASGTATTASGTDTYAMECSGTLGTETGTGSYTISFTSWGTDSGTWDVTMEK